MDINSIVGSILEDKYEILAVAGSGGMGTVFKARQLGLERYVAVKLLNPFLVSDQDSAARFEREARAISLLSHEHIATFYSYGILENSLPYMVMEFMEGKSLSDLLQESEYIEWKRSLRICRQVCQAMSYAHDSGVLHRDLKPGNIILCNLPEADYAKVVDFGLAKLTCDNDDRAQKLTKTGLLVGSIHYLSPEQALGNQADQRSDIYSLGCVLYQMLCGFIPFDADNPIGLLHKHATEQAAAPGTRRRISLPQGLDAVVLKSLAKKPNDRYQSMSQFDEDLKRIELGTDIGMISNLSQPGKVKDKTVIPLMISVLLAGALVLSCCWYFFSNQGNCWRAHMALAGRTTRAEKLEWLRISDRMDSAHDSQSASQIRLEVESALSRENRSPLDIARIYLDMAQYYLKRNNTEAAALWAKKSLLCLAKVNLAKHNETSFSRAELQALLTGSAEIALSGQTSFSNSQARELLLFSRRLQAIYGEQGFLALFDLVLHIAGMERKGISAAEIADSMCARDSALASAGQTSRLLAVSAKTESALRQLYGSKSTRIARHYFMLAEHLAKPGDASTLALKEQFLDKGILHLQECDSSMTSPELRAEWYKAANGYLDLKRPVKALPCAQNYRLSATYNPAEALMLLFRIMHELGRQAEAEAYAKEALASEKETQAQALQTLLATSNPDRYASRSMAIAEILEQMGEPGKAQRELIKDAEVLNESLASCAPKLKEKIANRLIDLYIRAYILCSKLGNYKEEEAAMLASLSLADTYRKKDLSPLMAREDLISFLCSRDRVSDTIPLVKELEAAPAERMLETIDSPDHGLSKVLPAYKSHNYKDAYNNLAEWLSKLARLELKRNTPHMSRLQILLDSLISCDEKEKAQKIIALALTRFSSAPESITLNKLKDRLR